MNEAHLHLTFNHLPIIIPIIGLLIMIGGILLKSEVIKRTAYAVFILGALALAEVFYSSAKAEAPQNMNTSFKSSVFFTNH